MLENTMGFKELVPLFDDVEIDQKINELLAEKARRATPEQKLAPASAFPIQTKVYLHRDEENNYDTAGKLGLSDEATANFKYCGHEVEFQIEVHEDGSSFATHVDKIQLSQPVKMS